MMGAVRTVVLLVVSMSIEELEGDFLGKLGLKLARLPLLLGKVVPALTRSDLLVDLHHEGQPLTAALDAGAPRAGRLGDFLRQGRGADDARDS